MVVTFCPGKRTFCDSDGFSCFDAQELSSCVTNGGGHDAHATPSSVARVFSKRGFHGQEGAVVNVMAQLQRSPTPPSVPASRSSRKFDSMKEARFSRRVEFSWFGNFITA